MNVADPKSAALDHGALFADRYKIIAVLGRGGMGEVYRAHDLAVGEEIALKILAQAGSACAADVVRFRQEVRLARKVTHPNIARVFDIGEHAGVVYLTMELIEGETLRQALRRAGWLPAKDALRLAIALAEGLAAAHAAGVVHRDLKPANVLLEPSGRVVITDFGIARSIVEPSELTVGAIGTPTYMAPEQMFGGAIDARTDLYALGLVLHEMLTGSKLEGGGPSAALPAALAEIVRRCTAPTPDARPASAVDVARALRSIAPAIDGSIAPAIDSAGAPPSDATVVLGARASSPSIATATPFTPAPLSATSVLREPALAVLPFRCRGPQAEEGIGDAIADELVDMLARTRGLRVLGSGATARYREARDPRIVGRELGASSVIDGSAQIAGDRVRITVRLVDATSGVQLWSDRFDSDLGDLLDLQERIAHRVAEELRLTLSTIAHRGAAPAEAIEHYLAGRQRMRAFDFAGAASGVASLDRCLALAPEFTPALAAHAIATLRAWYFDMGADANDWEKAASASVSRAAERASELPETSLAIGILATHRGDYRAAARAIERSLAIAPTYADAHEYLGMLECESGRGDEGTRRLRLASSLDPTLRYAGIFIARQQALRAHWDDVEATMAAVDRLRGSAILPLSTAMRIRMAAWRRDAGALRRMVADDPRTDAPNFRFVRLYARAMIGDADRSEVREALTRILTASNNPRFTSFTLQLATEINAALGEIQEAELHLSRAATSVLVDLDWLDRCPLLAPLRDLPSFGDVRRRVRTRADAIWSG